MDQVELRRNLDQAEAARLAPAACLSKDAVRRWPDPITDEGMRQNFAVDADRVLHSLAYTRYVDKTQVFSLVPNDHISHRVLHVQLVSKIGRTVGRSLGLNEDLIEAIALAHDIGHPPFGHDGERFLGAKCAEHGLGPFLHNVQSVHFLERVERGGRGLNLSLQVLDGALCHDGEVHTSMLEPSRDKDFAALDAEAAAKLADPRAPLRPMTMEGCVVRICDTVAYVGRDVEDAILLGLISREDLPAEATRVLGATNGTIVYRLVADLTAASLGRDQVGFSPAAGQALGALKAFNLERIYLDPRIKTEHPKLERAYDAVFETLLADVRAGREASPIFAEFLNDMSADYRDSLPAAAQVRDYIAALTDEHFLALFKDQTFPRTLPARF